MQYSTNQILEEGVAAHKEGRMDDAKRLYRSILKSQPAHPEANHNLGVLAISINDVKAALPLFKTALEGNFQNEQFWLSYIEALIIDEQFDNARQVLKQARGHGLSAGSLDSLEEQLLPKAHSPDAAQEHPPKELLDSLLTHYQSGRLSDAERLALEITQDFPQHQLSWKVLGAVLGATGRKSEAIEANKTAVALSPHDPVAHSNLGDTLKELGRLEEAQASFDEAIALKPDFFVAHYNLGVILQELGSLSEAEASYIQAIALKPDFAGSHYNLGVVLQQLGRLDESEACYEQAIALEPGFVEAHNNLGNALKKLGRLVEAEASFNKAIELRPDFAEAHNNLGNALNQLGRLAEAEASLNQAIELRPNYAEAHHNLADTLQELGRLDEALASYSEATVLKPDYADAHNNLGIILKELGRLEEAEASYTQAILFKPDHAEAHNNLGSTLRELGRLDEAEVSYNKAIAAKPDFASALYNRSQLLFDKAEYEAALRDSDGCALKKAKARSLISLYALGRATDIYKRLELLAVSDAEDINLAAFAAFITEVEKRPTAFEFCPNPLDLIHIANLSSHVNDPVSYVESVVDELDKIKTVWEPDGKSTVNGFQSPQSIDLFQSPTGKIAQLKSIIVNEIEAYYLKFKSQQCRYLKSFPTTRNLYGWTVTLKQQGHQTAHIHPGGWLSGVVYLRVVPSLGKDEGAIEFGLNSVDYHHAHSPSLILQPEEGDIVLFPSSLHHKTIPFTTDTDRIIVSFDLIPESARS